MEIDIRVHEYPNEWPINQIAVETALWTAFALQQNRLYQYTDGVISPN